MLTIIVMIEIQVSHRDQYYLVQIIKIVRFDSDIVGRELAESTNACGAPSSAVKQEVSLASTEIVVNNEAIESLAQ